MENDNQTATIEFILEGFFDFPQLQVLLFFAFLMIYLLSLTGNLLIVAIVYSSTKLHTPMYFFLTNLSFVDITYTTTIFPPMLAHFFLEGTHVSLPECLLQTYFFMAMVASELILLAVMAYDRYVAICNPLRYMVIMNQAMCIRMSVGTWALGLATPISHTIGVSRLSFCESHIINHFFCDLTALMKLSCTSTRSVETMTYIIGALIAMVPFVLTVTSYINIISAILKIRSTAGRRKAFSTCASHLTVVILFYGSICSTYIRPTSTYSVKSNKLWSLSYIAVTPLCNPLIYSLKNAELKSALRKNKNRA